MKTLIRIISLRHYTVHKMRSVLTLLGIVLGVALYMSVSTLTRSTQNSFKESIEALVGESKISITASESGFSEKVIEQVEAIDSVKYVVPVIENKAYFLNSKKEMIQVVVLGLDLLKEGSVRSYETEEGEDLLQDPLVFLNQPDSIIITQTFASDNALKMNDQIQLMTSNGPKDFVVRGLLKPKGVAKAFGGSLMIMDVDGARVSFRKEGKIDRLDIVPKEDQSDQSVKQKIEMELGPSFLVQLPDGQVQSLFKLVDAFNGLLQMMGIVCLLTAAFLVYNTISISIKDREVEIATLKTLGMTRLKVVLFFLGEAFILGFLGSVLGCVLGAFLAYTMLDAVNASLSAQMLSNAKVNSIVITFDVVLMSLILGTMVTILSVLKPAWSASRIDPITVLKKNNSTVDSDLMLNKILFVGPVLLGILILSFTLDDSKALFTSQCILFLAAVILTATLCVKFILQGLRKFSYRLGISRLLIVIDGLLRTPKTTWVSVVGLSVSLFMAVAFSTVNYSFTTNIKNWFDRVFVADYMLALGSGVIGNNVQPFHESKIKDIERVPGVQKNDKANVLAIRFTEFVYKNQIIKIKAIDQPPVNANFQNIDLIEADPKIITPQLFSGDTVIISENMPLNFDLKLGETMQLNTPQGPLNLKIIGIARDYASPVGVIYFSRSVFKKYWQDEHVNVVQVSKEDGISLADFEQSLNTHLGRFGFVPTSTADLKQQGYANVKAAFAPAQVIEWVAVLIAFFGLMNSIYLRVHQRIPEFGMLRSIGMSKRFLFLIIVSEALVQCFITCVMTVLLTATLLQLWFVTAISRFLGWYMSPFLAVKNLSVLIIVVLIFTVIAAVLPALLVRNLSIKDTTVHD